MLDQSRGLDISVFLCPNLNDMQGNKVYMYLPTCRWRISPIGPFLTLWSLHWCLYIDAFEQNAEVETGRWIDRMIKSIRFAKQFDHRRTASFDENIFTRVFFARLFFFPFPSLLSLVDGESMVPSSASFPPSIPPVSIAVGAGDDNGPETCPNKGAISLRHLCRGWIRRGWATYQWWWLWASSSVPINNDISFRARHNNPWYHNCCCRRFMFLLLTARDPGTDWSIWWWWIEEGKIHRYFDVYVRDKTGN